MKTKKIFNNVNHEQMSTDKPRMKRKREFSDENLMGSLVIFYDIFTEMVEATSLL